MTHTDAGHRSTPSTVDNLAIEEKSGYDSPATIPYTVDLETPASLAIATTVRPSVSKAPSRAFATAWAAQASAGASGASFPLGKAPDDSQERGGGALRLVTAPTLPHGGLSDATNTPGLANVRIIGHNAWVESLPRVPEASSAADASAAALGELALLDVPSAGAVSFATAVPEPSKGQRRQSYLSLEVLASALTFDDPQAALSSVLDAHPRANRRGDRSRVQAAALDVLVRLPDGTRAANAELHEATFEVPAFERPLLLVNDYPHLLVRLPSGAHCFIEVHPARRRGGELDPWMSRRIAGHAVLGPYIENFAGSLVFCVRTLSVTHVLSLTERHEAGACAVCREVVAR